jgi:hypothetical protein
MWSLGGTLGKTALLAALTFLAYLIGSFLEIDPEGRIASRYGPALASTRKPWYVNYLWNVEKKNSSKHIFPAIEASGRDGRRVAYSLSREARWDLLKLLQQRSTIPTSHHDWVLRSLELPEYTWRYESEPLPSLDERADAYAKKVAKRTKGALNDPDAVRATGIALAESDGDKIVAAVAEEMTQLASRLLVKNKDLYARYDKFTAEAALRINVSIPLASLLIVATLLSSLPLWLKSVLIVLALAFGFLLCRQGILRAASARDVIAQALIIDELQSRHIPPEASSADQAEVPAPSDAISQANDRQSTDGKASGN